MKTLKSNPKWGSRDRNFIAENTYDIIRWWRLLKYCLEINERKFSAEARFWEMIGGWLCIQGYDLPEWPEFKNLDNNKILSLFHSEDKTRKVRESVPDWLDEIGEAEVPDWEQEIQALNQESSVFIRVNTLKGGKSELISVLEAEGIEIEEVPDVKNALKLKKQRKLDHLKSYRKGLFEIQDAGSQQIAEYLQVLPDSVVIDACAGAGGKSLYLAALMNNSGKIISMDVEAYKLKELKNRAYRNGVNNITTELIKESTVEKYKGKADFLLLDVPCSGLGVLKRNPDAKWKLKPSFIEKILETQSDILRQYTQMLRPGGTLVYATCSVLSSENENQVSQFLEHNADFEMIEEKRVSPAHTGFDGFYMAKLKRIE
jgi:16S rRNA (cytosine967-C5)-methyltransferase